MRQYAERARPSCAGGLTFGLSRVLLLVVTLASVVLAAPALGRAATFTVNTTLDSTNTSACVLGAGQCSLRAAIQASDDSQGADVIDFGIPGSDPGFNRWATIIPQTPLPPVSDQVVIDGSSECVALVAADCSKPLVELLAPGAPGGAIGLLTGLRVVAGQTTVNDLSVVGFYIQISGDSGTSCFCGGNTFENNYLGLQPDGSIPDLGGAAPQPGFGWGSFGLYLYNTATNSSGGTCATCLDGNTIDRNVIAGIGVPAGGGISGSLVSITLSNHNTIQGNRLGTTLDGTAALTCCATGIYLSRSNDNLIGGTTNTPDVRCSGDCNLISSLGDYGVATASDSGDTFEGNYIGTDISGMKVLTPPGEGGILVEPDGSGTNPTRIGGTDPNGDQRNLITTNGVSIGVFDAANLVIEGNYIGTDRTGTSAIVTNNAVDGISVESGSGVQIGGTAGSSTSGCDGACNLISGNTDAINLNATNSKVEGNFIGTDVSGMNPLGNKGESGRGGVAVGGSGNTIGGLNPAAGNLIAFNGGTGIDNGGIGNAFLSNRIYDNACLGIQFARFGDIGCLGPLNNDSHGHDSPNANHFQNHPVITNVDVANGQTAVTVFLQNGNPNHPYKLQFFRNQSPAADSIPRLCSAYVQEQSSCAGPCDPVYFYGEGESLIGTEDVMTDGAGNSGKRTFTFPFALGPLEAITSTATDVTTNDTSEFSQCQADISITKADSPDPVATGGTLTYTLTVHNAGPAPATAVKVYDQLPSGEALLPGSPSASQGSCISGPFQGATSVTCDLGEIGRVGNATVTIQVQLDPSLTTSVSNTACTDWTGMRLGGLHCPLFDNGTEDYDPDSSNNTATETTAIGQATTGTIIVAKQALPATDPTAFTFTGDAHGSIAAGHSITVPNLAPGTYTSTEAVPAGWDLGSISCDDAASTSASSGDVKSATASFRLDPGETVTCTFTDYKRGTIIVQKQTQPTGATGSFTFTGDAAGTISAGGTIATSNLSTVGTPSYHATETDPSPSFDLTAIVCDDGTSPRVSSGDLSSRTANFRLDPGETVTCTFTNTQRGATITVTKSCPAGAAAVGDRFQITNNGVAVGDPVACGGSLQASVATGSYSIGEQAAGATILSNYVGDTTPSCAGTLQPGGTATCTLTNSLKPGGLSVRKTVGGLPLTGQQSFAFQIRQGASTTSQGTLIEQGAANVADSGNLNFTSKLSPNTVYELCETVMPGWKTNLPTPFVLFNASADNSTLCGNFSVNPGQTRVVAVDNTAPPGGLARTIGFWKNWSSCAASNGNQKPVLDQTLASAGGVPVGALNVKDCTTAVRLLEKSDIKTGAKMASDPAYNLAAQLLAAKLNIAAKAGSCNAVTAAITSAQTLLVAVKFNGTGTYAKAMTAAQATDANNLALTLDRYNNNLLC